MPFKTAPQIFHDKDDHPSSFVMYPLDLFLKINNLFTYNEQKILLALLGCKGDGSFSPSTQYMLNVTGITKPNHYFATRKVLKEDGYIVEIDGNIHVSTENILRETKEGREQKQKRRCGAKKLVAHL